MGSLMRKLEDKLSGSSKQDEQSHTIDSREAEHAQGLTGNRGTTINDQYGTSNTASGTNNVGLPFSGTRNGSGITGSTALESNTASGMPGSFPSNATNPGRDGLTSGTSTGGGIERHSHVTSNPPSGARMSTTTTTTGPHTTTTVGGLTNNNASSSLPNTRSANNSGLTNTRDSGGLTGTHNNTTSSALTGARNTDTSGLTGAYVGDSRNGLSNTTSTSGGLTGNNHGHSNTTSGGLTGNNHGHSNTMSGGFMGNNQGLSNTTSGGLTGNNHGHSNTTSGGFVGNNQGLSNTTSGGLTSNKNGLSHSSSTGLANNKYNTNSTGLTGNNHGLSHSTSGGLTGNTTSGGLTGNNHGLPHSTSSNLTGNDRGSTNTANYGRDERDFAGGAALAGPALSSGRTGQGSHLTREGYGSHGSYDNRDDYVDNRSTMEKAKDKVLPSRIDRPDDPVTGQNFSQESGSQNPRTANYGPGGSGAGSYDEYDTVQGRGQYAGGERLRDTERNSPRDPADPYSPRGQQTATNHRWGDDNYGASQGRREAGDTGSRSHLGDNSIRRSRDGGVTNGMNDSILKSGPHSHLENPAAIPTAGGYKVGGIGEGTNAYDETTGRSDHHHYGRDSALAVGGAAALGAGRHYDQEREHERGDGRNYSDRHYNTREEYVDNRSGLEKLKDKVVPGRTNRPDDPVTGQNYNEMNRNTYDTSRSSFDQNLNDNRHSLTSQRAGSTHPHHTNAAGAAGPTGFGHNVSYMHPDQAVTPITRNPDLVDRSLEPLSSHLDSRDRTSSHLGSGQHNGSHLGSHHHDGTQFDSRHNNGSHLGSRDTIGANSVLGHNDRGHDQQHHYGRDAALAGGAGALGAGAAHHYEQDRGNNYNTQDRGLGYGNDQQQNRPVQDGYNDNKTGQYNYNSRDRGIGNGSNRDDYNENRSGQYNLNNRDRGIGGTNRDEYIDNRTGMERLKDKVLPGRADRPDDPVTGTNYSQQQGYDSSRTGHNYGDSRPGHNYEDSRTGQNHGDSRTGYGQQSTYDNNTRGNTSKVGVGSGMGSGFGGHNRSSSSTGLGHNHSSTSGFTTHNIDGKRIGGVYATGYEQGWRDAVEHMQGLK